MDFIQELETAAASISVPLKVIVANMNEANMGLDGETEYPVMLVLPPIVTDNQQPSGLWVQSVDYNAMFLGRDVDATTPDYIVKDVEQKFVIPLRKLAREFFNKLNKSDIIFSGGKTRGVVRVVYTPTYGEFDAHLHGVIARCTIDIVEGVKC